MKEQVELFKQDKVKKAIERLQFYEPKEGYYLAFSGGKDSIVIKALADMAKVKYDAHYNVTTVDPPELTRFIKHNYPDVTWERKPLNMWNLIIKKKMPPTRLMRYCCDYLKESGGEGRVVITGVRWAESARRKNTRKEVEIYTKSKSKKALEDKEVFLNNDNDGKRRMFETCFQKQKKMVNPIIDWSDDDVWNFIKDNNIPYCELYDQGFDRLGCVGCPLQGKSGMERDFQRWSIFKKGYIKAFEKVVENMSGEQTWKSGEDVFNWWLNYEGSTENESDPNQITIDEVLKED